MTPTTDIVLGGRYRLTELIARGGMGEVWRAADELINRWVAVKVLRSELAGDPGFLGRFRAEARTTALITHPGIAALHDYGEQDGQAYLVMELVAGDPLSALIARAGVGGLDVDLALRYVGQAAMALQAAHDAGVVHRDIKPANLLITPGGQVKITDFGIARAVGDVSMTGTGIVMGTAHYLSPEQASGRDATSASDLYALGVVLYESLTGNRPFPGDNPVKVAMAQVNDAPPPLPASVPLVVHALVTKMMAKDSAYRPASAGLLAREIANLRATLRMETGGGWATDPPPTGRRRRVSELPTQFAVPEAYSAAPDAREVGRHRNQPTGLPPVPAPPVPPVPAPPVPAPTTAPMRPAPQVPPPTPPTREHSGFPPGWYREEPAPVELTPVRGPRRLPFGLDSVVSAEHRARFLLAVSLVALAATVIGYALSTG